MRDVERGLRVLLGALESLDVDYFVTGSLASSATEAFATLTTWTFVADLKPHKWMRFRRRASASNLMPMHR